MIKNEALVKALYDYYSKVEYIKYIDKTIDDQVIHQFIPFMSDYSKYYKWDKGMNVFDSAFSSLFVNTVAIANLEINKFIESDFGCPCSHHSKLKINKKTLTQIHKASKKKTKRDLNELLSS